MISIIEVFEELYGDLRISLRVERISFFDEFSLELCIILDDPIMNHDKSPRLREMRVAICLSDTTMGRPASMSDPDMITPEFIALGLELEIPNFSDCFDDFDMFIVIEDTDSCTIIASIFETL